MSTPSNPNALEQLGRISVLVADTSSLEDFQNINARDATTNPSLLLKAVEESSSQAWVDDAAEYARRSGETLEERIDRFVDKLAVNAGCAILQRLPGRVSTEVDAELSFDSDATRRRALRLIALYEEQGVAAERVLIKVASTWEGIQAARRLEAEGVRCNMTLLFSFAQAVACAEAEVTLISPFVGRVYDWYCRNKGVASLPIEQDPGVASVRRIYNYYKRQGIRTQVMAASFRHLQQVLALAGCDLLTISPGLLEELRHRVEPVARRLSAETSEDVTEDIRPLSESSFRWLHNEDAMAVEKLSEGIRRFAADSRRLKHLGAKLLG